MHRRNLYNSSHSPPEHTYRNRSPSPPHFPRGRKRERSPSHYSERREPSPHYREQSKPAHYSKNRSDYSPRRFSRSRSPRRFSRSRSPRRFSGSRSPRRISRSRSPRHHYHESSYDYPETRRSSHSSPMYSRGKSRSPSPQANSGFDYYNPYLNEDNSGHRFVESKESNSHSWEDVDVDENEEQHYHYEEHEAGTSWAKSNEVLDYSATVTRKTTNSDRGFGHGTQNISKPIKMDVTPEYTQKASGSPVSLRKIKSLREIENMTEAELHTFPIPKGSQHKLQKLLKEGYPYGNIKRSIIKNNFLKSQYTLSLMTRNPTMKRRTLEQVDSMTPLDIKTFPLSREGKINILIEEGMPELDARHVVIKEQIQGQAKQQSLKVGSMKKIFDKITYVEEADELPDDEIESFRLSPPSNIRLETLLSQGIPFIAAKRLIIKENYVRFLSNKLDRRATKRSRKLEKLSRKLMHSSVGKRAEKREREFTNTNPEYIQSQKPTFQGETLPVPSYKTPSVVEVKDKTNKGRFTWHKNQQSTSAMSVEGSQYPLVPTSGDGTQPMATKPAEGKSKRAIFKRKLKYFLSTGMPYNEAKKKAQILMWESTNQNVKLDYKHSTTPMPNPQTTKYNTGTNVQIQATQNAESSQSLTGNRPAEAKSKTATFKSQVKYLLSTGMPFHEARMKARMWEYSNQKVKLDNQHSTTPMPNPQVTPYNTGTKIQVQATQIAENSQSLTENRPAKGEPKTASFQSQLKYYLSKGMPYDKAYIKARNWESLNQNVELDYQDSTTPMPNSQATPYTTKVEVETPATTQIKEIGIIHAHYPEKILTEEHLDSIQESLTEQIITMGLKRPDLQPSFLSVRHRPGWLSVECADSATAVWLRSIATDLQPAEDVPINILDESEIPRKNVLVAYLTDSLEYTNEKIVSLLEVQNELKLSLLLRINVGTNTKVTFEANPKLSAELEQREFKLNYKFGFVKLKQTSI